MSRQLTAGKVRQHSDISFIGHIKSRVSVCSMNALLQYKQGQGIQCQTLWMLFESPLVKFSNFMTNLVILWTNFEPFPVIKISHLNVSSKFLIKMYFQCVIKMSHQVTYQNVSTKCFIKTSHQNVSSKSLIKCLFKMSHQNISSNVS